jgi:RNA ligase-like protein
MDSWHSYPSIFALGHKHLAELLLDPVIVEEKIDGSQFSFGLFEDGLRCRSKGAQLNIIAPDQMFQRAIDAVRDLPLHEGWTYRAEYLMKPKHNALVYDRIPRNHLIVFDINPGHEEYLSWAAKAEEAARIGLECVPLIFSGVVEDLQVFRAMLDTMSALGGQKVEGVVVKNYSRFGLDKKCLMGKFVSEAFKEVHAHAWKESNPTQGDVLLRLGDKYNSQARWQKAIQHLRERGLIEDSPRDIGLLFKEIWPDIEKECADEIKGALYAWAVPHLRRLVTRGFPEWYKEQLLAKQFERGDGDAA